MSAALGAVLISSCGFGTVDTDSFEPQPGSEQACENLIANLPETLDNSVRRDVSAEDPLAAAWGDPPIVLRCGVPLPSAYEPEATLTEIDGVGWLPEEGDGGAFFTSADRDVLVEVAIPDEYASDATTLLGELAGPILASVPERQRP